MKNMITGMLAVCAMMIVVGCGGGPESQFPLPDKVDNYAEQGSPDKVNFQTSLSASEVRSFYESELTSQGLTQNDLLTVEEGGVVSIVFDGHSSGQSLVVQSVELPQGSTNVNIRLESL